MAAWPRTARAQKSLPRIGWLVYGGATLGPIDRSLKDALVQTGSLMAATLKLSSAMPMENRINLRD